MTQADTTPIPSTPRRRNPAATKEKLIRSALELFTTVGFHASTTPQIASTANVAEGTIYRHFSSKSHMFNEIYRGAVHLYAKIFNDSDEMANCRKRLKTIARHWFALARRDAHIAMLVFVMPVNRLLDEESRTDAAWKAVCSDIPGQRPLTSAPLANKAPSASY